MSERRERPMAKVLDVSFAVVAAATILLTACGDSPKPGDEGSAPKNAAESPAAVQAPDNGDWPVWGHTRSRNMVSDAKNLPFDFDHMTL